MKVTTWDVELAIRRCRAALERLEPAIVELESDNGGGGENHPTTPEIASPEVTVGDVEGGETPSVADVEDEITRCRANLTRVIALTNKLEQEAKEDEGYVSVEETEEPIVAGPIPEEPGEVGARNGESKYAKTLLQRMGMKSKTQKSLELLAAAEQRATKLANEKAELDALQKRMDELDPEACPMPPELANLTDALKEAVEESMSREIVDPMDTELFYFVCQLFKYSPMTVNAQQGVEWSARQWTQNKRPQWTEKDRGWQITLCINKALDANPLHAKLTKKLDNYAVLSAVRKHHRFATTGIVRGNLWDRLWREKDWFYTRWWGSRSLPKN